MNKNLLTFGLGGVLILMTFLIFSNSISQNKIIPNEDKTKKEASQELAEKVQVFVFHSNKRCYSCATMGEYAKKTMEEVFQNEIKEGKVEFREINVDLPENKEVAQKFKAVGSAIFINTIINGADNIEEEVQLWRLLGSKDSFSEYLIEKVKEKLE